MVNRNLEEYATQEQLGGVMGYRWRLSPRVSNKGHNTRWAARQSPVGSPIHNMCSRPVALVPCWTASPDSSTYCVSFFFRPLRAANNMSTCTRTWLVRNFGLRFAATNTDKHLLQLALEVRCCSKRQQLTGSSNIRQICTPQVLQDWSIISKLRSIPAMQV